ncbi:MAG TPA: hypothetical protein VM553_08180 [Dongiaceae bacterium]|nr:hypothetical protein [Dongiaceae bacterium]
MKQKQKWAVMAIVLVLSACTVRYWLALWGAQYPVNDSQEAIVQSVARELGDGSIRVAYRRDADTLVVDTYDNTGTRQQRDEFPFSVTGSAQFGAAPVFLSDDSLVWFGRNDFTSVRINLITQTVEPLWEILGLTLEDGVNFEIAKAVVLDNGQLVMAGGDRRSAVSPFRRARVVVLNTNDTVQSAVLEQSTSFTSLVARGGSDQYFVQYFEFDPSIPAETAFTFLGEDDLLELQPQMDKGTLLQADLQGAWATEVFMAGLLHYSQDLVLDWQNNDVLVRKLVATSDEHYLMLQLIEDKMSVVKRDATGTVLWEREATADATLHGGLAERAGKILYTESFSSRVPGVRTTPGDPDLIEPITTVKENVRHQLLNANGKLISRFKEPEYNAVLLRDPMTGTDGSALEHKAGSCRYFSGMLLSNGQFASVSRWCSDNSVHNQQESLFLFSRASN